MGGKKARRCLFFVSFFFLNFSFNKHRRRHGAAEFTGWGALQQLVVVRPPRHTIAMQDSPIGWPGGVWQKRRFAASMAVKGAHLRQADVHRVSVRSETD